MHIQEVLLVEIITLATKWKLKMQLWRNKCQPLWLCILSLSLAACHNLQPVKRATALDWQPSDKHVLQDFDSSGRLAVKDDGKGSYANFSWQNFGKVQTIEVKTPLGNSVGVLCRDEQGVIAEDSHGQITTASSIEELSQRMLGFILPFDHLNQWIQGFWIAGEPYRLLSNGNLQQSGWIIQRQLRQQEGTPRIVQLSNARFDIKLVFDEYNLETDESLQYCGLRNSLA